MFLRLLWESFRRQRQRKLLAGLAILLGTTAVAAMLALATTIGDRIHRELAAYGANLLITPAATALDVHIGGVDIRPAAANTFLQEADLARLRGIFWANNLTGISPEIDVPDAGLVSAPGAAAIPVTVKGYWFAHAFGAMRTGAPALHPWWRLEGRWPAEGGSAASQVVLGRSLAAQQHLRLGDRIVLTPEVSAGAGVGGSAAATQAVEVVGIVGTGSAEDSEVFATTPFAQRLLAARPGTVNARTDRLSRVEVSARTRPEDAFARRDPEALSPSQREIWYCRPYANSIAFQIREAIPGADAEQVRRVEQSEGNVLRRISGLMWLVSAAALVAAGFAVSAAMATAILERRGEIGLMRSLGASRGTVATLFYVEAAVLAIAAGSLGFLLGSALAAWLGARIFPGAAAPAMFNPVLLPVVVGLALVVALAGSSPAIRQALRMEPSAVLRAGA